MRSAAVRFAASFLVAFAALPGHSSPAAAAVSASDAAYTYPLSFDETTMVTITLNVTENNDAKGAPLVTGQPRPLQLVDAKSSDPAVLVTRFRNCITLTFGTPGPTSFVLSYTMADGSNPGAFATDTGLITFVGSSTSSYLPPKDTSCGDPQFVAAANDDTAQTPVNQPIVIPVLNNDLPAGASNHHVTFGPGLRDDDVFQTTTQNAGTALAQPDNQVMYRPALNFAGTDSFSYILEAYAQPGFEGLNRTASVTVTVLPDPKTPPAVGNGQILVNGDTSTVVADSDSLPGETVTLEAATADPTALAGIVNFAWFVGDETAARQSGPSPKFSVALPDGVTSVKVVGTDDAGMTGMKSVTVTVGSALAMLADLPGLRPNQMGVAIALDRMCGGAAANDTPTESLTEDQQDARARCTAIAGADAGSQMRALDELSAADFNGSRTQTLLFTKSTYSGISDRLGALRSGARGVNLQGMNLIVAGKSISLAEVQQIIGKLLLGGGASADEPGSLLSDQWGVWTRGNITFGNKSSSDADHGFEADQFSLVTGLDYRLSNDTAVGGALSFGSSNVSYNPVGEGGLDTKSWALAFYGSSYLTQRGYVDAVFNIANSSYESHRHISYSDSLGAIDRSARGTTDGFTWSGGLSGGYDFAYKGLTVSPNASVFYADSGIDGFRESGARGLDLAYDSQTFQSLTGTWGLRINYALTLPFGVLMPYIRGDFVRELESSVALFNVHFVNDLDSASAPIVVRADDPDQSYWRFSGGMSAQLPFGFAGYVEYQRLESFEFVDFQDLAMGLRMQYRF